MEIEESCGCHVHFSKGKRLFGKKVHRFIYQKATKDFFKRIKSSSLPTVIKSKVIKQYYRVYAKKCNEEQFKRNRGGRGERSAEWNFQSERKGMGLEWRSFNLNGVRTWKDFKLLMSIAFETAGDMILGLNSWKKGNIYTQEVTIPKMIKKNEKIINVFERSKEIDIDVSKKREDEVIDIKSGDESIRISKLKDEEIVVNKEIRSKLNEALGGDEDL